MTLEEFADSLRMVRVGKYASLPYALYEDLFPPGEPDEGARARSYAFAQRHGFRIENKPDLKQVWFIKNA